MMNLLFCFLLSALILLAGKVNAGFELEEQTKLISPGVGRADSLSVAMYEDTMVVHAPLGDGGIVQVFRKDDTDWIKEAEWEVEDSLAQAIDVYEDTIVVGLSGATHLGITFAGYVLVYSFNGTDWTEVATLAPSDASTEDYFGFSVAVHQDTIVVGAPVKDDYKGACYIFAHSDGTWIEQTKLDAEYPEGATFSGFGWSVDVDQGTVVVGLPSFDENFEAAVFGSAHIYAWDSTAALWIEEAVLSRGASDLFGSSVSVHEDTVVVGGPGCNFFVFSRRVRASAWIYRRDGLSNWTEEAQLTASDGSLDDCFGFSVEVQEDTVVVGSPLNEGFRRNAGAVYIFVLDGTEWIEVGQLVSSNPSEEENLGYSIALDHGTVIASALGESSVYVFDLESLPDPTLAPSDSPSQAPTSSVSPTIGRTDTPTTATVPSQAPTGSAIPIIGTTNAPTVATVPDCDSSCPESTVCSLDGGISFWMYRGDGPFDFDGNPLSCVTECVASSWVAFKEKEGWSCGNC